MRGVKKGMGVDRFFLVWLSATLTLRDHSLYFTHYLLTRLQPDEIAMVYSSFRKSNRKVTLME